MTHVLLPTHLHDYTGGLRAADFDLPAGSTLADLLAAIDQRWPGLRFRIIDEQDGVRRHIKIFVAGESVRDIGITLQSDAEVMIVAALSGG
ncbi:MoaD/ThiS family protein [Viridibacterium curvum]|uniref:MoaD/ThiS family protein n=1 Tax=Viridibacterium curvum TaxID=1101404 RepID=A0ABP9R809_9RHOO